MDRPEIATAAAFGRNQTLAGSRLNVVILLMLISLVSFSCRRPTAAAPLVAPAEDVTVPPPPPAPAITLTASPATITAGQSTTLEWNARNANSVRIEPSIGEVSATGTRSLSPMSSVTYTATATGPGGMATDTVRVTVNVPAAPVAAPPPAPPDVSVEELFRRSVQTIYFDYDRSEIRPDQVGRLQSNARFLGENSSLRFTVGGHADERGTQEYNIGLADRRANAVRMFLIEQGVAASRIDTISYGEERPVCQQSNEGCWSQNRRAEFALRP